LPALLTEGTPQPANSSEQIDEPEARETFRRDCECSLEEAKVCELWRALTYEPTSDLALVDIKHFRDFALSAVRKYSL
jgi:hypothetical protein